MIDVSGTYPKKLMPKLLKAARESAESNHCPSCDCSHCSASEYFHSGVFCAVTKGGFFDDTDCRPWFRSFVERYDDANRQGGKDTITDIISRLEAVEKKLEDMLEKPPEQDPRSWVGKWGFFSDFDSSCPDDGFVGKLIECALERKSPFKHKIGSRWRYFRPLAPEELQQILKDNS